MSSVTPRAASGIVQPEHGGAGDGRSLRAARPLRDGIGSAPERMNQKPQATPVQGSKPQNSPRSENRNDPSRAGHASAREDTHAPTSDVRQLATDIGEQVTKSAERQLAGGKERAAEAIGHLAEALRETGGRLRAREMPVVDDYLGRAAT